MIRLSKLADYAFVILTHMITSDRPSWSAADLADKTTLPLPTVAKIMKLLAKGGVVAAQRGATGGYRLAGEPRAMNVAQVIRAVDGPIALTECVGDKSSRCAAKTFCGLHDCWDKLNDAIERALESILLIELAQRCPHNSCAVTRSGETLVQSVVEKV
jgi:FeS assembly SUF system regulator